MKWNLGWICILVVLAVVLISQCSGPGAPLNASNDTTASNVAQQAITEAIAAQPPPPVEPLSKSSVRSGLRHFALAGVEGLAGEMIYSQNCYDLLSREFSWAKLDRCGAFDALAAKQLEYDESAPTTGTEATWFDPETAAGRYLKAATAAGQASEEADQRLSTLQVRVASSRQPKAKAISTPPPTLAATESPPTLEGQGTVTPNNATQEGE